MNETIDDTQLPAEPSAVAARYGRDPQSRSRQRAWLWVTAGVLVVAFVAWMIWRAAIGADSSIDSVVSAFEPINTTSMDVSIEVTLDKTATAACAVEVQSEQKAIVGWIVLDVPASDNATRQLSQRVNTTEQGVTALISRCWLT